MNADPIASILHNQQPAGRAACEYVLQHTQADIGGFDIGCKGRKERAALAWIARSHGCSANETHGGAGKTSTPTRASCGSTSRPTAGRANGSRYAPGACSSSSTTSEHNVVCSKSAASVAHGVLSIP